MSICLKQKGYRSYCGVFFFFLFVRFLDPLFLTVPPVLGLRVDAGDQGVGEGASGDQVTITTKTSSTTVFNTGVCILLVKVQSAKDSKIWQSPFTAGALHHVNLDQSMACISIIQEVWNSCLNYMEH